MKPEKMTAEELEHYLAALERDERAVLAAVFRRHIAAVEAERDGLRSTVEAERVWLDFAGVPMPETEGFQSWRVAHLVGQRDDARNERDALRERAEALERDRDAARKLGVNEHKARESAESRLAAIRQRAGDVPGAFKAARTDEAGWMGRVLRFVAGEDDSLTSMDRARALWPPVSIEQTPECATCPERADFECLCCKGPLQRGTAPDAVTDALELAAVAPLRRTTVQPSAPAVPKTGDLSEYDKVLRSEAVCDGRLVRGLDAQTACPVDGEFEGPPTNEPPAQETNDGHASACPGCDECAPERVCPHDVERCEECFAPTAAGRCTCAGEGTCEWCEKMTEVDRLAAVHLPIRSDDTDLRPVLRDAEPSTAEAFATVRVALGRIAELAKAFPCPGDCGVDEVGAHEGCARCAWDEMQAAAAAALTDAPPVFTLEEVRRAARELTTLDDKDRFAVELVLGALDRFRGERS